MNLISLSIRRPVFAWILMFSLIVFGAVSLTKLGVSQMPDVDFPIVSVSINYPGASPEVVESEVIERVEERLLTVEGIKEMRSTARQDGGNVRLEFNINRNVDVALQEIQAALSSLRLPTDVEPPVIRKTNPEEEPIIFIGVSGDDEIKNVLDWTNNFLLDQIQFIEGVGEVSIAGFSTRNMRIWVDPAKLRRYELTITDVLDTLQTQHLEAAAGQVVFGDKEFRVRSLGESSTTKDLENIRILRRGGQAIQPGVNIRIKDVARVEDGLSDIRRMAELGGREAIAVSVKKQRGSNEVKVAEAIRNKIDSLKERVPKGYQVLVNIDFTVPTLAVYNTTIEKLWFASIVTIIVCFLFLGSLQGAINILFSIPTSIVGTFIILYLSGMTLNLFTLLALTLAISIVVDDAIMLLENIVRHFRMGKSPAKAAYDGSVEVLPSATAASLAVIAIFIPVLFMGGVIGKFFFQFGITMCAAVMLSLLEAVTITPMRAAAFLSTSPKISKFESWLEDLFHKLGEIYKRFLLQSLRVSWLVVVVSLGLFVGSMFLFKSIRQELIPPQDQNAILISGQTPPGTSLAKTHEKAKEIEKILNKHPEVDRFFMSIGAGGPGASVNSVFIPLILKDRKDRDIGHLALMDKIREDLKSVKGFRAQLRDISTRNLVSGRSFPVSLNLNGPELSVLKEKADIIMKRLQDENLAVDLDIDFKLGLPELMILPLREEMASRGVSIEAVSRTLSVALAGVAQGRVTQNGERIDMRIKVPEELFNNADDIKQVYVRNLAGNLIPLSEVVKSQEKSSFNSITRVNRQRSVNVSGALAKGASQAVVLEKARAIANEVLPPGYSVSYDGASGGFKEAFDGFAMVLLMGILVAYMILAVQFNSFIHPIVILIALPFSLSGAFAGLAMTGQSLNLYSYIGIIVLMGIAKKNSIMMVEFTNQLRESGQDIRTALGNACAIRLRPILMTSVATVMAAFPLILGQEIGIETRKPLGITIIGGSIVATIFTLIVVPSFYLIMSKLENKKAKHQEQAFINELA